MTEIAPPGSVVSTIDRDAIIDLASQLIAIPSPSGDELAVMQFVAGWCEQRGLDHRIVASDPDRPNVIVTVGDPASGPVVAMNGHLDTVPVSDPDAWRSDPFQPTLSDDGTALIGRGASDMKASVAVMLLVLERLRNAVTRGAVQVHVVSDEETSGVVGTQYVLSEIEAGRLPRPTYCLIGEKSDLKVRNAERGILGLEITFHGRASHTAAARVTGINAIAKAAKGILAIERDIDRHHPAVGRPVISVNMVEGGVAHNVVPGECRISVDRRLIPGETLESVVEEISRQLEAVAATDADFRYTMTIDPGDNFIPANITEASSPIVTALQRSILQVTGNVPEYFVAWAGATDGRFYRQAGIETVGYGPGGMNAHGANEAVFIDDLLTQARVYEATILEVLGAAPQA